MPAPAGGCPSSAAHLGNTRPPHQNCSSCNMESGLEIYICCHSTFYLSPTIFLVGSFCGGALAGAGLDLLKTLPRTEVSFLSSLAVLLSLCFPDQSSSSLSSNLTTLSPLLAPAYWRPDNILKERFGIFNKVKEANFTKGIEREENYEIIK